MSADRKKCMDCDQPAARWKKRCHKHAKLHSREKPREAGKPMSVRRDLTDYFEESGLPGERQAEIVQDILDLMRFHLDGVRQGGSANA